MISIAASDTTLLTISFIACVSVDHRTRDKSRRVYCNGMDALDFLRLPGMDSVFAACCSEDGETGMAYQWDPRRARRARLIRLAAALAIGASAITVPVAVLLAAAPL